jgi:hypothetical protein
VRTYKNRRENGGRMLAPAKTKRSNNSHELLWRYVLRFFNLNDHCQFATVNLQ